MRSPSPHSPSSLLPIGTTAETGPALRADAARNRMRIIEAARAVFAERGLDAPTSEIAHRAGVGEATLFRRFPTKDDLVVAIVEVQMEDAIAIAADCLEEPDPWRGIERFMVETLERRITDQGALEAVKDRCIVSDHLEGHRRRYLDLTSGLLRRAQEAGVVRDDLRAPDLGLLITAAGAVGGLPFPGLRDDLWRRYLCVILDGMRPEGATRLRPGAPPRKAFERPADCGA